MIDGHGRHIDYLRISVTDRCNFRCHYCMPEKQSFLPNSATLTTQEIIDLTQHFIAHGIRKIRLTGGEPLVRRDIADVIAALGGMIGNGLEELTLTTNGSRLVQFASLLAKSGIKRVNVSMDSLDLAQFRGITRGGDLSVVLAGIDAAHTEGIDIKINMVALKNQNQSQLLPIAEYCAAHGHDLSIIETMPLGEGVAGQTNHYISADNFVAPLFENQRRIPLAYRTAGPARYWQVEPLGLRLGLISPMSRNFCDGCNRLRLTTDGKIFMCLGSDMHVDFKKALREDGPEAVDILLRHALKLKPARHDFETQLAQPDKRLARHMNATGG